MVLDETRAPRCLHIAGAYTLAEELTGTGTVLQAAGSRIGSMKFKSWVIDAYLSGHAPEATPRLRL